MKKKDQVEQSIKDFDDPEDLMPIPDRLKQDSPQASLNEAGRALVAKEVAVVAVEPDFEDRIKSRQRAHELKVSNL